MKRILLFMVLGGVFAASANAQIEYEDVLVLKPGQRFEKFLSCWWNTAKGNIASVVIREPDGKLTAIEDGVTKSKLKQNDILARAACDKLDPYKIPRESHVRFSELRADGKWHIRSAKKDFGTYDKIAFMRENEQHFIAIAVNAGQYYYIDDTGRKELLEGRPQNFYTNSRLTKGAVMLFNADAVPADILNKMPREQQVAILEKMHKSSATKRVWVSDGQTYTVDGKSKLFFDASGKHLIEAQPANVFFADGKQFNKNVSGGGTIVFVNSTTDNWAYFFEIYLSFKDNTNVKDVISAYLTSENGKEYVNWYKIEEKNGVSVLRRGKKVL
jgi:hypothetical protein